jgi:hypothetical protein
MRKAQFLLVFYLLFCGVLVAEAQKVKMSKTQKQKKYTAATEREIKEFFDSYAEDLRQHRREAIANRYDPRGYFRMGNGSKTLVSLEDVKNRYLTKWVGPKSFEWRDVSIEVLSPAAAVVVGLFDWQRDAGEKETYSYTGLLVKQSGKWRIRLEDESGAPPQLPQSTQPSQQERKAITLDSTVLDKYVGQYQITPERIMTVTNENGKLMAQLTGQPKVEIFAESETKFFLKVIDAQITFVKDAEGRVANMILHQRGAVLRHKKSNKPALHILIKPH